MSDRHYDVAFAGLGASACILIHELHSAGWLNGKKIAIIEPSDKKTNDRTFCFWAEPDSQLVKRFKPIISHSWDQVSFNGIVSSIGPLRYHHVRGIDLYDFTKQIIGNYSPDWINTSVERCASEDHTVTVFLPDQTITTPLCFDSRTVPMPSVEFPEVAIHQSFLGFKVRLRHAAPDAAFATLMDFDFEQDGFTQFIYRLPFAPDHMLIELTRFGDEKVDPIQAAPQLESYIRRQYGHFEILEQEYGCIPMVYTEQSVTSEPGIIPLGTRAGMVKASTGYAFKNMFDHAQQLSKTLLANQEVSYQKS
ncbi:MAG: lycopene cyclase family protein, partial [Cyclobacteriaceae bacterium]